MIPEWTQPTLSQEEIRRNGGVPPPPEPILPNKFTIQLYNPDQQIVVNLNPSTWNTSQYWGFDMPQQTFRTPSSSALDRTQSDPTAAIATPTIEFKWKKTSKLNKDLMCYLSGKTKNPDGSKKKSKEPDIPMAFFRTLREVTVYEPNLSRVDIEDPKGFEVVLLLGAIVIRDVYFSQMKETFNISESARTRQNSAPAVPRRSSAEARVPVSQQPPPARFQQNYPYPNSHSQPQPYQPYQNNQRPQLQLQTPSQQRPPPTDPRSQWEIDAETARLKKQVEVEERERERQAKERERRDKEEAKRVKKMLDQEAKETQKRKAEIDRETERLRRQYGTQGQHMHAQGIPQIHTPQPPPQPQRPYLRPPHAPQYSAPAVQQHNYGPRPFQPNGPYLQPPHAVSSGIFSSTSTSPALKPKRSSFFGFRSHSDDHTQRLQSKRSAIF